MRFETGRKNARYKCAKKVTPENSKLVNVFLARIPGTYVRPFPANAFITKKTSPFVTTCAFRYSEVQQLAANTKHASPRRVMSAV